MSGTFQELLTEAQRAASGTPELFDALAPLPALLENDPEAGLMRVRKLLEFVVRDVYGRRYSEPAGTRPMENLTQRLAKDGYLTKKLAASANLIRELGNVGVHGFGEKISPDDVVWALAHLVPIMRWYREQVGPTVVLGADSAHPADREDEGPGPTMMLSGRPAGSVGRCWD